MHARTAPLKNDRVALASGQASLLREGASADGRRMRALVPDREYAGVGERGSGKEMDRVAQFERFGFVRSDGVGGDGVVGYFYV